MYQRSDVRIFFGDGAYSNYCQSQYDDVHFEYSHGLCVDLRRAVSGDSVDGNCRSRTGNEYMFNDWNDLGDNGFSEAGSNGLSDTETADFSVVAIG